MKSNFALSLSFDGIRLLHRSLGGWNLVGQVALDDSDVSGALERLRSAALTLEPKGLATKLLIPNDQIKYIALDTTRTDEDAVREALHGATPYAVDDLNYDFAKGGGRTYIAAVARETLDEAKAFAAEHGFNPVSFAAVPEPFTYVGEAFFGGVDGQTAERDPEPVIVTGQADVVVPEPEPAPVDEPTDTPNEDAVAEPEPEAQDAPSTETSEPEDAPEASEAATPVDDHNIPDEADTDEADHEEGTASDVTSTDIAETETDETAVEDAEPLTSAAEVDTVEPEASEDETPDDNAKGPDATPMFSSRLRADRNEGRPAPTESTETPSKPQRAEPTFSRSAPPTLAVPTGTGDGSTSPLAAPKRDAQDAAPLAPITADTPSADIAPPITGQAKGALPPDAASAAASLSIPIEDDSPSDTQDTDGDKDADPDTARGATAAAMGAATAVSGAVGGAVGGIFASRRMAQAETKKAASDDTTKSGEKSKLTVFGARKQPKKKPKTVVGGKPRFLGLILTAILLLFLLAIAAFAALSEDNIARWFGFGGSDTQLASDPAEPQSDTDAAALEVAATETPVAPEPEAEPAEDTLAAPTALTGGQVLTPEEAARIYAATGVWQRAPRIPTTPRTTSLDAMTLGSAPSSVPRVPASPLASASSISGDALIATPIDPPPPDATFDFNADGLIVATPDGNVTPDGILVIAGPPPLNPPTRPGTVAPEVTPQDQLAAVIPDEAAPVTDAPEGVIVISGRPVIEPPVRPGTAAPAAQPQSQALASGEEPLVAQDGLLVLAGSPPVLPPVRPGTAAPRAVPAVPDAQPDEASDVAVAETPAPEASDPDTLPEGLNLIAGPPPVLPPVRPGTQAPARNDAVDTLTSDVAAALDIGTATSETAQTPTADTTRPRTRPDQIVQAAAAAQNVPVLGNLTVSEAAAFRPRTRPVGLAPAPIEPEIESEEEAAAEPAPTGLQIAPEIAAAVQAAANRPNPIVNPTAQAVPTSSRPDPRPRNMARIVERANQATERAAAQAAAATPTIAPTAVAPSGPTGNAVARNATLDNAINLREVNLIGIYGGSSDRRALVRLGNGRYVRVTVGDRLDGGRVTAISATALSYEKRGRALTLQVAG